eukprot:6035085-Pyramimonas_sp.AAC.1
MSSEKDSADRILFGSPVGDAEAARAAAESEAKPKAKPEAKPKGKPKAKAKATPCVCLRGQH